MKKTIVLASGNKDKLREIRQILTDYSIVPCSELGFLDDVEETGETFYENALLKAMAVSKALNLPALADDSGLCVEALNWGPGIYSARYSGLGNKGNNDLILKNMQGEKNRTAKFVSCIVYYSPNGEIVTATGETYGKILFKEEGENGFGYDPIFYSDDLNKSLGIASPEEKNTISHRFRALNQIKDKLKGLL